MEHTIKNDTVIYIHNRFIGCKREHTNIAKLNQNRILEESYSGAKYQLKKGDVVFFDRTNNWDLSFYLTPCGVEFKIDCGYDWFSKNN
jgi:hypothetical protein